jgi:hypothetical protein
MGDVLTDGAALLGLGADQAKRCLARNWILQNSSRCPSDDRTSRAFGFVA